MSAHTVSVCFMNHGAASQGSRRCKLSQHPSSTHFNPICVRYYFAISGLMSCKWQALRKKMKWQRLHSQRFCGFPPYLLITKPHSAQRRVFWSAAGQVRVTHNAQRHSSPGEQIQRIHRSSLWSSKHILVGGSMHSFMGVYNGHANWQLGEREPCQETQRHKGVIQ